MKTATKNLPPTGTKVMIVPSNIEGMMAGASYAEHHSDGRVRLIYTDGSDEWSAKSIDAEALESLTFLGIVSLVQSGRGGAI